MQHASKSWNKLSQDITKAKNLMSFKKELMLVFIVRKSKDIIIDTNTNLMLWGLKPLRGSVCVQIIPYFLSSAWS